MDVDVDSSASIGTHTGVHIGMGADVAVCMGGYRWSWSAAGMVHDACCQSQSTATPPLQLCKAQLIYGEDILLTASPTWLQH